METTTVQVRQRGSLTLPISVREKYGIKTGDSFQLVDLDGVFEKTVRENKLKIIEWEEFGWNELSFDAY